MRPAVIMLGITIALFALFDGLTPGSASASAASATVQVRAQIKPYLRFMAEQQRHTFAVGEQDLRRGYVDLPGSLQIAIRSNVRDRVSVAVTGGDYAVMVLNPWGTANEVIFEAAELLPGQLVAKSIDIRVLLSKEMAQGDYPLLLDLSPQAY